MPIYFELFDKVWHSAQGAEKQHFDKLHNWAREKRFPVCDFPDLFIELFKESNNLLAFKRFTFC